MLVYGCLKLWFGYRLKVEGKRASILKVSCFAGFGVLLLLDLVFVFAVVAGLYVSVFGGILSAFAFAHVCFTCICCLPSFDFLCLCLSLFVLMSICWSLFAVCLS